MSKLLFICGFPSGGTELTKTILNAHPDVQISDEMPGLIDILRYGYDQTTTFSNINSIRAFQRLLSKLDHWNTIRNLCYDFTSDLQTKKILSLEEVLRECCLGQGVDVWGNKTPQYTENIDAILKLFPNALFLIVIRDVRDVCLSWRKKWGKDMVWCAAKWADRMAKGKSTTNNLSQNRYLYVRFEDLLSKTEEMCSRICKFLDIRFSRNMLQPQRYTHEMIGGKKNYGQSIKMDNFGKWKKELHTETVKRIEEIACETMKMFGYRIEYATHQRPISFWETWHGRWRDSWAMLLVGNRYSQRNSFWHRLREVRNVLYWRFLRLQSKD